MRDETALRAPVICHNDVCLENVVFRDGRAVALLDFDFAAPGRRTFDLAAFARMCVPVDDDVNPAWLGRILRPLKVAGSNQEEATFGDGSMSRALFEVRKLGWQTLPLTTCRSRRTFREAPSDAVGRASGG